MQKARERHQVVGMGMTVTQLRTPQASSLPGLHSHGVTVIGLEESGQHVTEPLVPLRGLETWAAGRAYGGHRGQV